jgi:hypothetical protein
MHYIISVRAPLQITYAVIGLYTINMVNLIVALRVINVGHSHKSMDPITLLTGLAAKANSIITIFQKLRFQKLLTAVAPYSAAGCRGV